MLDWLFEKAKIYKKQDLYAIYKKHDLIKKTGSK